MSHRPFPSVAPLTVKGKILVFILRIIARLSAPLFFKDRPMPNFEENPAHFSFRDILYFSYKYYLNPPEKAETDALTRHFADMKFVFPKAEDNAPSITLSSGGDLMPYKWLNSSSGKNLWTHIGDWYFGADIVYANLETPIDNRKALNPVPEVMLNNMRFNGDEDLFNLFNGMNAHKGLDIVSTANNHSLDMGEEGIRQTHEFLDKKGIMHTGTACSPDEQWQVQVIEKEGIRVAFVAATYCLNDIRISEGKEWLVNQGRFNLPNADLSLIANLVNNARIQADFVVLALHNGNAYQAYPSAHTRANIRRIFELCGPDLILGSHPHNPQPLEQVEYVCPHTGMQKRGIAVYSQGDFVAYDIFTWCHLHLGLKFTLKRLSDNSVAVCAMEAMPQYVWAQKKEGRMNFEFIPLLQAEQFKSKMDHRSIKELQEIQRLWNTHLAPQLSPFSV